MSRTTARAAAMQLIYEKTAGGQGGEDTLRMVYDELREMPMPGSGKVGENEPEMMWATTMNPETRRLIKVMPEDAARTAEYFDLLLGNNLAGRKNHIAENGYKYLDMADVS